jgi:hypothetical protein
MTELILLSAALFSTAVTALLVNRQRLAHLPARASGRRRQR